MFQIKSTKIILFLAIIIGLTCTVFGDGFIVIPKPPHPRPPYHFTPFPLEVEYHRVKVKITDQIATTAIDQVFYNPTHRRLEGFYLLPVPLLHLSEPRQGFVL